ncbi:hypothetical protein R4Z09_19710 [Niallia oryzisoli]|uniref:Uncharacterized protein n=1 Tax=Niallia oryzisoli TaxID=1737571 RepID=A0ABZ2CB56_9BACI
MQRVFTMQLKNAKSIASFVETDSSFRLTIFKSSYKDEYFQTPSNSITINGEDSVKRLYKFLVKADLEDCFREVESTNSLKYDYETVQTLSHNQPTIVCCISSGILTFYEADDTSGDTYKPTKEINLNGQEVIKIYSLLTYIFGSPLSVKRKAGYREIRKEKQPSGWELLK